MKIRTASVSDVPAIHSLISYYAEQDMMLFRSPADLYEHLQTFMVAEQADRIVGCCALEVVWADLAEIKSLAVDPDYKDRGVGKKLVLSAVEWARQLGIQRVFALTLSPEFFQKLGFKNIDTGELPMKVWSDCARCPKQDQCDEVAVIKNVAAEEPSPGS